MGCGYGTGWEWCCALVVGSGGWDTGMGRGLEYGAGILAWWEVIIFFCGLENTTFSKIAISQISSFEIWFQSRVV